MVVEWTPKWYELDQCIVVGDVDLFYLSNENCFADDFDRDAYEVRAEIISIDHGWKFAVEVKVVERTGFTLGKRVQMMTPAEMTSLHNQLIEKYKRLLDISYAEWDIQQ